VVCVWNKAKGEVKLNTCMAAAQFQYKKEILAVTPAYRPTCTTEDGQLGQNMLCIFAENRRLINN
jgi:hypothetical protein